jgi:hypothetical protein
MEQGGVGDAKHSPTSPLVAGCPNLLILEGSEPETAQLRRVFGQYGEVSVVSGVSRALDALSKNPAPMVAGLTWSTGSGELLRDLSGSEHPDYVSLLVVCVSPTADLVRQIFYAQERRRLDVRLVCTPVRDEDVHLFIASSMHRRHPRDDRPQISDVGTALGRRVGLTSRELDVLRCALSGLDRSSMVHTLAVRPSTLRSHARAILGKFMVRYPQYPVRNLVELVNVLLRQAPELAASTEEDAEAPKLVR